MGTGYFNNGTFTLTAMLPDPSAATRRTIKELLAAASQRLFEMTGGQASFGKIFLSVHPHGMAGADLRFDADLGADPGKKISANSDASGIGFPWQSASLPLGDDVLGDPEDCCKFDNWSDPDQQTPQPRAVARLLHEFGHYAFGLLDEYGACRCIMACKGILAFCDVDHETVIHGAHRPQSCWDMIAEHYGLLRPSQSGFDSAPGDCAAIEWCDVAPESRIVFATHNHECSLSHRAANATAQAWRFIGKNHQVEVRHPAPGSGEEPLFAISGGVAWLGEPRALSSASVVLIGDPNGGDHRYAPELVNRLVRGFGAMASILSPTPIHKELREFASKSSGVAEVVTHTGVRAEVDLRTRVLTRLGCSTDGWGVNCQHRLLRGHGTPPVSFGIHVEPGAAAAAFVLIRPATHEPSGLAPSVPSHPETLTIHDPDGYSYPLEHADDGSIQVSTVAAPKPGVWSMTVAGGNGSGDDATPVSILSLIDNPNVWIRAKHPVDDGHEIKMTAQISDEVRRANQHTLALASAPPSAPPPTTGQDWADAPSSAGSFSAIQATHRADVPGYHDYRLDFHYRDRNGKQAPVRRVLPYQVCIQERQQPHERAQAAAKHANQAQGSADA
ncbi:MAG: hypothetical protein AB8H80_09755 [Planctomycetota bacterium]